jgi:hypothetical protein
MGWNGTTCKYHGMGWVGNFFLGMGWYGMGRLVRSHGPVFSSHPIPLGALVHISSKVKMKTIPPENVLISACPIYRIVGSFKISGFINNRS